LGAETLRRIGAVDLTKTTSTRSLDPGNRQDRYWVIVTLKLRKEYLHAVTCDTLVLLQMKNWTVWYRSIKRFSMLTYMGVTNF